METELATALSTFLRRIEPLLSGTASATHDLALALDRLAESPPGASFSGPSDSSAPRPASAADRWHPRQRRGGRRFEDRGGRCCRKHGPAERLYDSSVAPRPRDRRDGARGSASSGGVWRRSTVVSRRIIDAANTLKRGEWTSYGEICFLTYGHYQSRPRRRSRHVHIARRDEHAHRVLEHTGHIPDGWVGRRWRSGRVQEASHRRRC